MRRYFSKLGPGLLVTAAFVGPGTITTASTAGAHYGFALLWALLFSVVATAILQEMAARLGLVTRQSLATAMRNTFSQPLLGYASVILVVSAIGIGNAAYEAGNIAGAALALASISSLGVPHWSAVIALTAGLLIASGQYKVLEKVLIALVLVMSLLFLATAIIVRPGIGDMMSAMFPPALPDGGTLLVIALIGTTVVPYNLFLHATAVSEKWSEQIPLPTALREARLDSGLSIGLGGLITLAILSTAASAFFYTQTAFTSDSMANQLEPLLGAGAKYIFAAGLFASGLTSAITAPLAAAYAVCGALNWPTEISSRPARIIAFSVIACGGLFAMSGIRPLTAILFAQAANGLLLPVVAVFLLVVMNRKSVLGHYTNGLLANSLGALVVFVAITLGVFKLATL